MFTDPKYVKDISGQTFAIKVVNGTDSSFIPLDESNVDYQEIMALVDAGNLTIAEADPVEGLPS